MTEETVYNEALGHFDTFYEQNKGLVYRTIKEYYFFYGEIKIVERDDLHQEALYGFYKAYATFNPENGLKFSTVVIPKMRGYIRMFLRDKAHLIRKPRNVVTLERLCKQYDITSIDQFDTLGDTLKTYDLTIPKAKELFLATLVFNKTINLNAKFKDTESEQETYMEIVPSPELIPYDKVVRNDMMDILSITRISPRDREILILKSQGYTQQEIAKIVGLSQMSVSRILKSLMDKIRGTIREYYIT